MEDSNREARHRVLLRASSWTRDEWLWIITEFFDELYLHHPGLAKYFADRCAFPIEKLAGLLSMIARDEPERDALFRSVFLTGFDHLDLGIGRLEFEEFIELLAAVLASKGYHTERTLAHHVWLKDLRYLANAMLLSAPN